MASATTHEVLESLVGQRVRLKHTDADDFWDAVLAEVKVQTYGEERRDEPVYIFIWEDPDGQMQGVRATSGLALSVNTDRDPAEVTYRSSYGNIEFMDPRECPHITKPIPESQIREWEARRAKYSSLLKLLN